MEYTNSKTKMRINLDYLSEAERNFYWKALQKFHENVNWLIFDEFAFGMKSPIYLNRSSHPYLWHSRICLFNWGFNKE
jgi:hypothetical protein